MTEQIDPQAPSSLARRLRAGQVVVTAEINPPRHAGAEPVRRQARTLRGVVDAANVTDCTRGIVRMSATAAALLVREEGVEPIMEMTCRDRNRIALQSELLGLSALGLYNVLLLSGDDPRHGDQPDAKAVFDMNGTELLAVANRLRCEGRLMGADRQMQQPPVLYLGAAGDPERDLKQPANMALAAKAESGGDFIQTQPAFDVDRFAQWIALARERGLTERLNILAGVFVLDSARRAEFLKSEVPGIVMPEATVQRLADAADPKAEGIRLAIEQVEALLAIDGVRGVHLMGIDATEAFRAVVEGSSLARHVAAGES
jgi:methylenetetrahydrofolate reductase (NADPH)